MKKSNLFGVMWMPFLLIGFMMTMNIIEGRI